MTYVHGYQDQENLRLRDQAGTLVDLVHDGVTFPAGSTVLELGCGVGAQTLELARRSPGARLTSVDVSTHSLAQAARRTSTAGIDNVTFLLSDVYDLPLADGPLTAGSFDHVFVCFVLEHLPRPDEALRRVAELLAPGGTLTVVEGDHGSTYFHPDSAAAREAVACQVTLQARAGGDASIGRRLYPLLADAGYTDVRVEPRMVYVDARRPDLVDGFIRKTFTAMIAGVREPAVATGLITPERFDEGVRGLERTAEPDGTFCYTFFRATAAAPGQDKPPIWVASVPVARHSRAMTRTDTPQTWDERATLLAMLQYTRDTAADKCAGLAHDDSGRAPLASSPLMTMGGVLNHLRWVEHSWIENRFVDGPDLGPWTDDSPDQEFVDGANLELDVVLAGYREQARRTDAVIAEHDLDERSRTPLGSGELPTLRWVLLHLIEENARHNGHLDLLREVLDGVTGN